MLEIARQILLSHHEVDYVDLSRVFRGQIVSVSDAAEALHAAEAENRDIKIVWRPLGAECAVVFEEVG